MITQPSMEPIHRTLVRLFDTNRDGRVTSGELPAATIGGLEQRGSTGVADGVLQNTEWARLEASGNFTSLKAMAREARRELARVPVRERQLEKQRAYYAQAVKDADANHIGVFERFFRILFGLFSQRLREETAQMDSNHFLATELQEAHGKLIKRCIADLDEARTDIEARRVSVKAALAGIAGAATTGLAIPDAAGALPQRTHQSSTQ